MTVLATDKTGTLTEGTMFAAALWTPQRDATLDGAGYDPDRADSRTATRSSHRPTRRT